MRTVVAGNNQAAVLTLDLLLEASRPEDLLVIAPEAAHHVWHASLAHHAGERGVECLVPDDVNDPAVIEKVAKHRADLLLSVYYTQLFRSEFLEAIHGPCLNFHPSLLPRHRGVAPLIWAIAEGDSYTGLTVHLIDPGIDTGSVLWQHRMPIHPDETGYELHRKMANLVQGTAAEVIRTVRGGRSLPDPQAQSGDASYHSRRDPALNHLDWSWTRERVRNVVRALAPPLPGAYALFEGERIAVNHAEVVDASPGVAPRPAGMVAKAPSGALWVWASDGPLEIGVENAERLFEGALLT